MKISEQHIDPTYRLNGGFKPTLKRTADRDGPDFFPTPAWATQALVENEALIRTEVHWLQPGYQPPLSTEPDSFLCNTEHEVLTRPSQERLGSVGQVMLAEARTTASSKRLSRGALAPCNPATTRCAQAM
jgi:hypothetical protein